MDIWTSVITGREQFSGKMLRLSSEDILLSSEMLDQMVDYYMATYEIVDNNQQICNVELWSKDFYSERRDYIIPNFIFFILKHLIDAVNTQLKFRSGVSGAIAEQVEDKTKNFHIVTFIIDNNYIKCLTTIVDNEQGDRKNTAQLLLNRDRKTNYLSSHETGVGAQLMEFGFKTGSNKKLVFIEISGGPEYPVEKHVKEDTEKLIKEAMFGLIFLIT
ncbi:hypothetical protein C1645_811389 [Glomus cerebriforme]|uniref:Uncharacterized protein n=1 Tax=Glomus cerebriforme TaxID=658196 RepID=A0A397TNU0_9GLOM|nr:hypothetical protein C1645_811389 [Glomus cerebriforme]